MKYFLARIFMGAAAVVAISLILAGCSKSLDSNTIIFSSYDFDQHRQTVFSMDADGGNQNQLTGVNGIAGTSLVFPDRSKVLFWGQYAKDFIDLNSCRLDLPIRNVIRVSVSPDGEEVAAIAEIPDSSLHLIRSDGSDDRVIFDIYDTTEQVALLEDSIRDHFEDFANLEVGYFSDVSFTPDSSRLLVVVHVDDIEQLENCKKILQCRTVIVSMATDGSDVRYIAQDDMMDDFVISPDGEMIYYANKNAICSVKMDGTDQQTLVELERNVSPILMNWEYEDPYIFELSCDGSEIVYESMDGYLCLMNSDGSNWRQLTRIDYGNLLTMGEPVFAPDGERIIYSSWVDEGDSRSYDLFSIGLDGTEKSRLTSYAGNEYVCGNG